MSKSSLIGLTASGPNDGPNDGPPAVRPLIPEPTEEERQKLVKSARRLACRHGWDAFAAALEAVCQEGAKTYRSYPEAGEIWARRARIVQELQKVKRGA